MQKVTKNEQIIRQIELLLIELKQSLNVPSRTLPCHDGKSKVSNNQRHEFSGLTEKIYKLLEEGFFKEPRIISEIQKKLQNDGTKKPTTSLMPPLILLVRKKILSRDKPPKGVYKYYQR